MRADRAPDPERTEGPHVPPSCAREGVGASVPSNPSAWDANTRRKRTTPNAVGSRWGGVTEIERAEAVARGRELTEAEAHAEHLQALEQTLFGKPAPSAAEHVYRLEHGRLRKVRRSRRGSARGA